MNVRTNLFQNREDRQPIITAMITCNGLQDVIRSDVAKKTSQMYGLNYTKESPMSICNLNSLRKRLTKSKTDSSTKTSGTRNGNRFLACHFEWMVKILRPWMYFGWIIYCLVVTYFP